LIWRKRHYWVIELSGCQQLETKRKHLSRHCNNGFLSADPRLPFPEPIVKDAVSGINGNPGTLGTTRKDGSTVLATL